jgi:hypothetical protein
MPDAGQGDPAYVSARMVRKSNLSGLCDSHGLFLRGPKERKIDPFGQCLGGELGRLATCNYRLDNLRCQERQPRHSSDVAVCDPFAFSDLRN